MAGDYSTRGSPVNGGSGRREGVLATSPLEGGLGDRVARSDLERFFELLLCAEIHPAALIEEAEGDTVFGVPRIEIPRLQVGLFGHLLPLGVRVLAESFGHQLVGRRHLFVVLDRQPAELNRVVVV